MAAAAPGAPPVPDLPDAVLLTDVLVRLADPAVPGSEKITLIEGADAADAARIESFATALRDNGFAPPTFNATAIGWSDRVPGDVTATVDVVPTDDVGVFTFPLDFHPYEASWQLAAGSAELLLSLDGAQEDPSSTEQPPTESPVTASPSPTP